MSDYYFVVSLVDGVKKQIQQFTPQIIPFAKVTGDYERVTWKTQHEEEILPPIQICIETYESNRRLSQQYTHVPGNFSPAYLDTLTVELTNLRPMMELALNVERWTLEKHSKKT